MTGAANAQLDTARADLALPLVSDTLAQVYVVQDSSICATALSAYRGVVHPAARGATSVEVIRAGAMFVVSSPEVQAGQGEFTNRIVFDSTFKMLTNYLM
ncbi:MAG: hypothetical protein ABJE47_18990 [bacterium]